MPVWYTWCLYYVLFFLFFFSLYLIGLLSLLRGYQLDLHCELLCYGCIAWMKACIYFLTCCWASRVPKAGSSFSDHSLTMRTSNTI